MLIVQGPGQAGGAEASRRRGAPFGPRPEARGPAQRLCAPRPTLEGPAHHLCPPQSAASRAAPCPQPCGQQQHDLGLPPLAGSRGRSGRGVPKRGYPGGIAGS